MDSDSGDEGNGELICVNSVTDHFSVDPTKIQNITTRTNAILII